MMLPREDLGRGEQSCLSAGFHGGQHREDRDERLA